MSDTRRNRHNSSVEWVEGKQSWESESDLLKLSADASENSAEGTVWDPDPERLGSYETEENQQA